MPKRDEMMMTTREMDKIKTNKKKNEEEEEGEHKGAWVERDEWKKEDKRNLSSSSSRKKKGDNRATKVIRRKANWDRHLRPYKRPDAAILIYQINTLKQNFITIYQKKNISLDSFKK